jgi:hypothetical protein
MASRCFIIIMATNEREKYQRRKDSFHEGICYQNLLCQYRDKFLQTYFLKTRPSPLAAYQQISCNPTPMFHFTRVVTVACPLPLNGFISLRMDRDMRLITRRQKLLGADAACIGIVVVFNVFIRLRCLMVQ